MDPGAPSTLLTIFSLILHLQPGAPEDQIRLDALMKDNYLYVIRIIEAFRVTVIRKQGFGLRDLCEIEAINTGAMHKFKIVQSKPFSFWVALCAVQVFSDISRAVQVFSDTSRAVQVFSDISCAVQVFSDISRAVQVFSDISRVVQVFSDISRAVQVFSDISSAVQVFSDISRAILVFSDISRAVQVFSDVSHTVLVFLDVSHAVLVFSDVSHTVLVFSDVSHAVLVFSDVSRAVLVFSVAGYSTPVFLNTSCTMQVFIKADCAVEVFSDTGSAEQRFLKADCTMCGLYVSHATQVFLDIRYAAQVLLFSGHMHVFMKAVHTTQIFLDVDHAMQIFSNMGPSWMSDVLCRSSCTLAMLHRSYCSLAVCMSSLELSTLRKSSRMLTCIAYSIQVFSDTGPSRMSNTLCRDSQFTGRDMDSVLEFVFFVHVMYCDAVYTSVVAPGNPLTYRAKLFYPLCDSSYKPGETWYAGCSNLNSKYLRTRKIYPGRNEAHRKVKDKVLYLELTLAMGETVSHQGFWELIWLTEPVSSMVPTNTIWPLSSKDVLQDYFLIIPAESAQPSTSVEASNVHIGPFFRSPNESLEVSQNDSILEDFVSSSQNDYVDGHATSETPSIQLSEPLSSMVPTNTIWPLSSKDVLQDYFLIIPAESAQPSTSVDASQVLYNPVSPSEAVDITHVSLENLESINTQQTPSFMLHETSLSFSTPMVSDIMNPQDEFLSSISQASWMTETLPLPKTHADIATSDFKKESFVLESSSSRETLSFFSSVLEKTPVVSITPLLSLNTPNFLESSVNLPSLTISDEVTIISTKNIFDSIFSNLGLTQDSIISPSMGVLMTSSPDTSATYEWSHSAFPDVSEIFLESNKSADILATRLMPVFVSQYEQTFLPSYTLSSSFMYNQSEGYLETITMNPSWFVEETIQTSIVSDFPFLVQSSAEVESVLSSDMVVSVSSSYTDGLESSMEFTSLFDSVSTKAPVVTIFPSETLGLETHSFSVIESTILMPSLTELFVSSVSTADFESPFTIVAIPESTPFLDSSFFIPMNTVEAPAFVPTESVMYFSQTLFPFVESENISDSTSFFSVVPTFATTNLFSSLPEEISSSFSLASSDVSAVVTQDSSSMFAILETAFSSFDMGTSIPPFTDTISMETTLWPTVNPTSVASFIPSSSAEWTDRSSNVLFSEMWEVTPSIEFESGIFYTSTFSGATSSLLPSSSALDSTMLALSSSSFASDHTSSALIEETLQTSSFFFVPLTTELPAFISATVMETSEAHTSVASSNFLVSSTLSVSQELSLPSDISLLPTISLTKTSNLLSTVSQETILNSPNPQSSLNLFTTTSSTLSLSTQMSVSLMSTPLSIQVPSSSLFSSPTELTTFTPTTSTPTLVIHTDTITSTTQASTASTTKPETTTMSTTSVPITPPSGLTAATSSPTTTRPTRVCDVSNPEPYLVNAVLSRGSNIQNITESIKKLLTLNFNRPVEIEVYTVLESFSFMVTSGPLVYIAVAVVNVLARSSLVIGPAPPIISLQTALLELDQRFHVQTVLQFVPQSVDIKLCTFSEQIQRGLNQALYEVRRLRQERENVTVQIVNISTSLPREMIWKAPVTVTYTVQDRNGFLNGTEISNQLRNLSLVEFSFFLGFPVKQIAEPSQYPQLNTSPHLKDTWLRTVLLGVQEQQLRDEAFQTEMERKLAQLISEATLQKRRWKRASYAGSNTVQMVNISRMEGLDDPVELIYFIEDQYGGRLAADKASSLINEVNIQRAAIILGYRLQGVVAQPLNQPPETDQQAQNLWIIVGVAVPVLVVTIIIVILYWKLCRTDKLDFQPDTMSNLQQRQKLQAPNVKGFDFAKQHLGQHNKDDVLIIHEPPLPVLHGPLKDSTPSENGDIPTPKSKASTKPNKVGRHRSSRVTPSDAGSTASEPSSGKDSGEEGSPRPSAPPRETPQRPKAKGEMPVLGSGLEQHSSASIFEHVDRMSRSSEASRRLPSKIQLIAMQPMATPPLHGLSVAEREVEANKINREIQTTLRHKSEIEHHRNKIRLRAKRKGHYEFPLVDVVGMSDTKERQRMYRRAQMQFDKILDPVMGVPTVFIEPRKSSRARRSPKQRRRQQGSSSLPDADRDRLIATDSDGTYKRPPGVSNSAYVSDPDLPSDNPTPVSELGKYPGSLPRGPPPAQYVAPQPSIEEVRQTMQSLLDDAFALVAPSSQVAVQAGNSPSGQQQSNDTSTLSGRGSTAWGAQYPSHQSQHYNRFVDYGVTQPSAPSLLTRSPGFGSGFLPPSEVAPAEPQQTEAQYPARMYPEDIPSVARPRPLGSTSGPAQIHQLTQVGIASRMGAQPADLVSNRSGQPSGGPSWPPYYSRDEETARNHPHRDAGHVHGAQDYGTPQMFGGNRPSGRQSSAHLPPSLCYPAGSAEDIHPGHSSASLIKAIREELLRLSQKQVVAPAYHS
ncbi:UPF0606 protein KIAA1549 homolog [Mantella aurantiaca]